MQNLPKQGTNGRAEGHQQQVLLTARKMVFLGRSDAEIMELLELTKEDIHDIRAKASRTDALSSNGEK